MFPRKLKNGITFVVFFIFFIIQFSSLYNKKEDIPNKILDISEKSEKVLFQQSTLSVAPVQQSSPLYVLVLSSMGRSGSTMLSEMLSNIENSVLFFEPLWFIRNRQCLKEKQCRDDYIRTIFACNYSNEFEKWLKNNGLFVKFFNSEAHACIKSKNATSKKDCLHSFNMREACQASKARVMKVIRARLIWFSKWLVNSEMNFKIIYLNRDPRGSLNSINKFGKDWEKNQSILCGRLQEDMEAFNILKELYPTKVLQISYEELCLNPNEEASRILKFLFGKHIVSERIKEYIIEHMTKGDGKGNMNTQKDSGQAFDAWRWKIKESLLKRIEEEPACLKSINEMNHSVFHSIDRVRNATIPLFI